MRSYTIAKYMPPGLTPVGTIDWDNPGAERSAIDEVAELPQARTALARYVADLEERFALGGVYDRRCLPTGEEFLEIVVGHPLGGTMLCHCFSPLLAVQLFADAVERYVVADRKQGTLYWRIHPAICPFLDDGWTRYDTDLERTVTRSEMWYTIRARLLIL